MWSLMKAHLSHFSTFVPLSLDKRVHYWSMGNGVLRSRLCGPPRSPTHAVFRRARNFWTRWNYLNWKWKNWNTSHFVHLDRISNDDHFQAVSGRRGGPTHQQQSTINSIIHTDRISGSAPWNSCSTLFHLHQIAPLFSHLFIAFSTERIHNLFLFPISYSSQFLMRPGAGD